MTLLYNFKERYYGNRVPMTYVIHGRFNGYGLQEFIDSVLALNPDGTPRYPDARFVTGKQLIDWMENPVGLDGTDNTSVRPKKRDDKRYGIMLENNIVSESIKINLKAPESAKITRVIIFDNIGNIVFEGGNVWNLKNKAGRNVANGAYLVFVEAVGVSGKAYRYQTKLGVKR
jgi:hypothetical protein